MKGQFYTFTRNGPVPAGTPTPKPKAEKYAIGYVHNLLTERSVTRKAYGSISRNRRSAHC